MVGVPVPAAVSRFSEASIHVAGSRVLISSNAGSRLVSDEGVRVESKSPDAQDGHLWCHARQPNRNFRDCKPEHATSEDQHPPTGASHRKPIPGSAPLAQSADDRHGRCAAGNSSGRLARGAHPFARRRGFFVLGSGLQTMFPLPSRRPPSTPRPPTARARGHGGLRAASAALDTPSSPLPDQRSVAYPVRGTTPVASWPGPTPSSLHDGAEPVAPERWRQR